MKFHRALIRKLDEIKKNFDTSKRIFIAGSEGQLGQDLQKVFSYVFKPENILATDILKQKKQDNAINYQILDALNKNEYSQKV